jgi:GNAT superfamily N-acetyltransferase
MSGQVVGLVAAALSEPIGGARRQLLRELSWQRLMINALVVHPSFWRRGIGRQLLGAAEQWGRERGARIVLLDTYIHSCVSVPFYEQGMGYRRQSLVFSKSLDAVSLPGESP